MGARGRDDGSGERGEEETSAWSNDRARARAVFAAIHVNHSAGVGRYVGAAAGTISALIHAILRQTPPTGEYHGPEIDPVASRTRSRGHSVLQPMECRHHDLAELLKSSTVELCRRKAKEWDRMRAFASAMLMIGGVLSAYASPSDGQGVFADSVEPRTVEAGLDTSARCNPEDIAVYGPQLPPTSDRPCPAHTGEADETARARAYLIATATPGYTMTRQGPERAIERLHPEFVNRLAAAITEARAAGLSLAGIFSAYRPPAFGVGGFADKFHSLHTYGLAVDVTGIGGPGSPSSLLWHEIAARHGVICPYGPHNLLEWNHCQPTWVKIILAEDPLRETVSADGPISLEGMFEVGSSVIAASSSVGASNADPPTHLFNPPRVGAAMPVEQRLTATALIQTAYEGGRLRQTTRSIFDSRAMKGPFSVGKSGWPKGVPRIANLIPRRPNSSAKNHPLLLKPIVMPRIAAMAQGR